MRKKWLFTACLCTMLFAACQSEAVGVPEQPGVNQTLEQNDRLPDSSNNEQANENKPEEQKQENGSNGPAPSKTDNNPVKEEKNDTEEKKNTEEKQEEIPVYETNSACPYAITVMPVVTINTNNAAVSEDKNYTSAVMSFYSPDGSYEKEQLAAGIRLRGNGSRKLDKKSYKFKLEDKKNLYSLSTGKQKTWVLIANHSDGSLLRNYTAYKLQREFGCIDWEPNCTSVEVYLNGEYQGVYLLCEEIRVSKEAVNIDDSNTNRVDTGFLLQFSAYAGADKHRFVANDAAYEIMSDVSENAATADKQVAYIKDYLEQCMDALENKSKAEAEKLMNLDSLVACYLTEEISKNVDAQWDSFYLYKDIKGKLVFGPVWDFDLAFGNDSRTLSGNEESWEGVFVGNGKGSVNGTKAGTWFAVAMGRDWFREMVQEAWNKEVSRFRQLPAEISAVAEAYAPAFNNNFKLWKILGAKTVIETPVISGLKTHKEQVDYLTSWIEKRVEWLNGEFNRENFVKDGATGKRTVVKHDTYGFVANESTLNLLESKKNISDEVIIDSIEAVWGFGAEIPPNLFDNNLHNKYCTVSYNGYYPVIFEMKEATVITDYVIYTGNDTSTFANRNPLKWTFYGSNDGENWNVLHEVKDGRNALGAEDNTGYGFTSKKTGEYKFYAFEFVNDDTIQMAEIVLLK